MESTNSTRRMYPIGSAGVFILIESSDSQSSSSSSSFILSDRQMFTPFLWRACVRICSTLLAGIFFCAVSFISFACSSA